MSTPSDWRLFREKLPEWQENYMDKLLCEYKKLIESEEKASSKFWELKDRIMADSRNPGVILRVNKSDMEMDIVGLIKDGAITFEDLDGFSEELVERVKSLYNTFVGFN